jgi:hypothetical protein
MAELKTQVTTQSVTAFLKGVLPDEKRKDSLSLLKIFKEATGLKPKMWGASIVGFGSYHYESTRSTQKGDWPLTGFSPRKQSISVYIMPGFKAYEHFLKNLGTYKVSGGSCLYIKKLSDINEKVLTELIQKSVADMKKKYH